MSETREAVEPETEHAAPAVGAAPTPGVEDHPELSRKLLAWAPPGLERMQGDLWLAARKSTIAGVVLAVPLVLALTLPQSPLGLGPLGRAWWIPLLTTLNGLILFADAAVAIFRILRRSLRAVREGYSLRILGMVLADRSRDAGFLLQGARVYSELGESERRLVAALRLWVPTLYVAAGFWMSVALGALALLAARGLVSPAGVAAGTLLPPLLFVLAAVACSALEASLLRRARRAWYKRPWTQDLAVADAAEWRAAAAAAAGEHGAGAPPALWPLYAALVVVVLASALAVLPPATLVPASSVGAIMSSVGGFSFRRTQARVAAIEVYRPYRLEADGSVSPAEAGEILNTLTYVGRPAESVEGLLPPARPYEASWYPVPAPAHWRTDMEPFWSDSVWAAVERGLTQEELAYLDSAASHAASAEFSRLAYAGAADVVGTRYERPFDESDVFWAMPIPRYTPVRRAANVHLGIAALRLAEGRPAEAERVVREVVSVGFLLVDDSPLLIGSLVGRWLVERGGVALERVLRASGRAPEADILSAAAQASQRAVSIATPVVDEAGGRAFLESLPPIVEDPDVMRSMRWEYLGILSALTPCLNLQRVVFGPGEDHEVWLRKVRESLVRYPADEELFDVMMRGFGSNPDPGPLARLMAVAMGGMDRPGSCAQLIAALPSLM